MGGRRVAVTRYVGAAEERHEAHVVEKLTAAVAQGCTSVTVPSTVLEESLQLRTADVESSGYRVGPVRSSGGESTVLAPSGEQRGHVLGAGDGVALAQGDNVLFLLDATDAEVAEDARAEVETVCDVEFTLATKDSEVEATLAYCLDGLSWSAHYSVVVDLEHDRYDFVGKYSLTNNCGRDLDDCDVELLVCRMFSTKERKKKRINKKSSKRKSTNNANTESMAEFLAVGNESCGDFWGRGAAEVAYRLENAVTMKNGHTTSVTFTQGVIEPINKHHFVRFTVPGDRMGLVEREEGITTVTGEAVLEIQNLKEHGLGMALPFGELRVFNAGGALSEASVGHMPSTSADEVIRIALGAEHGLTAKREVLSFTKSESKRTISEKIQLTISNNSLTPLTVLVEDTVYRWSNWKVVEVEPDFHPNGVDKIRWVLPEVQVDTEETIVYTVVYSWDADADPLPLAVPCLQ